MISDKATVTVQELVTVSIQGHEPIPDLLKKSEWNGMWELVNKAGHKVIVMDETGPFSALFSSFFEAKPLNVRVVAVSPNLLVPITKEAA